MTTAIVIAAAEPSGDMLGAQLISEVRRARDDVCFFGIGGKLMRAAGCECIGDIAALSVMGYVDAVAKLPRILPLRAKLIRAIAARKPAMFIGVDAPDFNLGVASHARAHGITTIQYGSPSVWMWRRGRIGKVAKAADHVWCLFPFEKEYYKDASVNASFTGHPLAAKQYPAKDEARQKLGINNNAEVIAVLPGSRLMELRQHLPLTAQTINKLKNDKRVFVTAAADEETRQQIQTALPDCIMATSAADALVAADIAVVKSGTVALEAAIIGTPIVAFYLPSRMAQAAMQWRKFYLPFFTLPNILAGRFVAPELIGIVDAKADAIAAEVQKLSSQPQRVATMRAAFDKMRQSLIGETTPAAQVIIMLSSLDSRLRGNDGLE